MQNTNFKTLAKVSYDFIRNHNFEKIREFDITFFECTFGYYFIRCIEKNNYLYTTRENLKLIKQYN